MGTLLDRTVEEHDTIIARLSINLTTACHPPIHSQHPASSLHLLLLSLLCLIQTHFSSLMSDFYLVSSLNSSLRLHAALLTLSHRQHAAIKVRPKLTCSQHRIFSASWHAFLAPGPPTARLGFPARETAQALRSEAPIRHIACSSQALRLRLLELCAV